MQKFDKFDLQERYSVTGYPAPYAFYGEYLATLNKRGDADRGKALKPNNGKGGNPSALVKEGQLVDILDYDRSPAGVITFKAFLPLDSFGPDKVKGFYTNFVFESSADCKKAGWKS